MTPRFPCQLQYKGRGSTPLHISRDTNTQLIQIAAKWAIRTGASWTRTGVARALITLFSLGEDTVSMQAWEIRERLQKGIKHVLESEGMTPRSSQQTVPSEPLSTSPHPLR